MLVRLYPNKFRPAPAVRVGIVTRTAYAGFRQSESFATAEQTIYLVKFLIKLFSKSLRVWAAPTTCIRMRKAPDYVPPLRGGAGNKKFAGVGSAHDLQPNAHSPDGMKPAALRRDICRRE
jgi:hypothetical protein